MYPFKIEGKNKKGKRNLIIFFFFSAWHSSKLHDMTSFSLILVCWGQTMNLPIKSMAVVVLKPSCSALTLCLGVNSQSFWVLLPALFSWLRCVCAILGLGTIPWRTVSSQCWGEPWSSHMSLCTRYLLICAAMALSYLIIRVLLDPRLICTICKTCILCQNRTWHPYPYNLNLIVSVHHVYMQTHTSSYVISLPPIAGASWEALWLATGH